MFKHFNNKLKLEKLTVSLVINIYNNITKFNIETKLQNKEIEILVSEKISIIFKLPFINAILILADLEVLFDNPVY